MGFDVPKLKIPAQLCRSSPPSGAYLARLTATLEDQFSEANMPYCIAAVHIYIRQWYRCYSTEVQIHVGGIDPTGIGKYHMEEMLWLQQKVYELGFRSIDVLQLHVELQIMDFVNGIKDCSEKMFNGLGILGKGCMSIWIRC